MNIDKNIPMPVSRGPKTSVLLSMKVGDSIFANDGNTASSRFYNSAKQISYRKKGMKFSGRNENGGVRIWRIE